MKSNRSANKSGAVKPGTTYRRLKDAVAEMQAIQRGERACFTEASVPASGHEHVD